MRRVLAVVLLAAGLQQVDADEPARRMRFGYWLPVFMFGSWFDQKRDLAALMVVEDVRYRPPRWSWEVEKVGEFDIDRLPADTSPTTLRWIAALSDQI